MIGAEVSEDPDGRQINAEKALQSASVLTQVSLGSGWLSSVPGQMILINNDKNGRPRAFHTAGIMSLRSMLAK
jgi:hypothetical protein